jgi:hypothetical protein
LKKIPRDVIPQLKPDEVEIIATYGEIVKKARNLDSDLGDSLDAPSEVFSYLQGLPLKVASLPCYAATQFTTETEACEATGVKFSRTAEHRWMLKGTSNLPVLPSPGMGKFPLLTGSNSDPRGGYR